MPMYASTASGPGGVGDPDGRDELDDDDEDDDEVKEVAAEVEVENEEVGATVAAATVRSWWAV